MRNFLSLITEIKLSGALTSGRVVSETTDPSFIVPTAVALARDHLLVVNSQFNNRDGTPVLAVTVSTIKPPSRPDHRRASLLVVPGMATDWL